MSNHSKHTKKRTASEPRACLCGKEEFAHGRCIFHQRPAKNDERKLFCAWFATTLYHGDAQQTAKEKYRHIILNGVVPFVNALSRSWVADWYFINHFGIVDVGLLLTSPDAAPYLARDIRAQHVPFLEIGKLAPEEYGGQEGVRLCYKALCDFSKLRVEILKAGLGLRFDRQLIHYFLNQAGLDNMDEGLLHLVQASRWAEMSHPDFWERCWEILPSKNRG